MDTDNNNDNGMVALDAEGTILIAGRGAAPCIVSKLDEYTAWLALGSVARLPHRFHLLIPVLELELFTAVITAAPTRTEVSILSAVPINAEESAELAARRRLADLWNTAESGSIDGHPLLPQTGGNGAPQRAAGDGGVAPAPRARGRIEAVAVTTSRPTPSSNRLLRRWTTAPIIYARGRR